MLPKEKQHKKRRCGGTEEGNITKSMPVQFEWGTIKCTRTAFRNKRDREREVEGKKGQVPVYSRVVRLTTSNVGKLSDPDLTKHLSRAIIVKPKN
jgi:hypothetical protein